MLASRGRLKQQSGTLYDANGNGLALAASDKLRVKISSQDNATPELDLVSGTTTAGNSTVSITQRAAPAAYVIQIGETDMTALAIGTYTVEVIFVDSTTSPANADKHIEWGSLTVMDAPGGTTG